jgi:hypothetical protein
MATHDLDLHIQVLEWSLGERPTFPPTHTTEQQQALEDSRRAALRILRRERDKPAPDANAAADLVDARAAYYEAHAEEAEDDCQVGEADEREGYAVELRQLASHIRALAPEPAPKLDDIEDLDLAVARICDFAVVSWDGRCSDICVSVGSADVTISCDRAVGPPSSHLAAAYAAVRELVKGGKQCE